MQFMSLINVILLTSNILSIQRSTASSYKNIKYHNKNIKYHNKNIYYDTIELPSAGYVNITYQKVDVFKYKIKMLGDIRTIGIIYYDDENNCAIDDIILIAIHDYIDSLRDILYHDTGYMSYCYIGNDILLEIINHIKYIVEYEVLLGI